MVGTLLMLHERRTNMTETVNMARLPLMRLRIRRFTRKLVLYLGYEFMHCYDCHAMDMKSDINLMCGAFTLDGMKKL